MAGVPLAAPAGFPGAASATTDPAQPSAPFMI